LHFSPVLIRDLQQKFDQPEKLSTVGVSSVARILRFSPEFRLNISKHGKESPKVGKMAKELMSEKFARIMMAMIKFC
jgi:hypothetical protein